jgi:hypothetical protein
MFEPASLDEARNAIARQVQAEQALLQELRTDVRTLLHPSHMIRPHSATAVSFAASEGATNRLVFDPFSVQLVRIVDSQGRQRFLDVISPRTDPDELSERHHQAGDSLHVLMTDLGVEHLSELSSMIPSGSKVRQEPESVRSSWPRDYRELAEWAVLYHRIKLSDWASDTLIVLGGLLRSKIFSEDLFVQMGELMWEAIEDHRRNNLRIFVVGIAKNSGVLARYRLAMALENALPAGAARYVHVPRKLEHKVYKWREYARGPEDAESEPGGERAKFVIGSMFLARFGAERHDPVWAIDLLERQKSDAGEIFGYLLQDAVEGFPIPFYPRCLQRAREYAQAVDFDLDVMQDAIVDATRDLVEPDKHEVFDGLALVPNVSARKS